MFYNEEEHTFTFKSIEVFIDYENKEGLKCKKHFNRLIDLVRYMKYKYKHKLDIYDDKNIFYIKN